MKFRCWCSVGCGVQCSGFGARVAGFGVQCLGFGVWGSGFGVQYLGSRAWGSVFGVQGLGIKVVYLQLELPPESTAPPAEEIFN